MSKNARQIDYRLRLAKYVERRMLCTAFQKLSLFYPLHNYKYIGFGAFYFSDFYLFHKELGIEKMLSIERSNALEIQERYNFNKPFQCIEIDFRDSGVVLPELDWGEPTIAWLDYTSVLNSAIIADLETVLRQASSGSILVFSMNVESTSYDPSESQIKEGFDRFSVFSELIGSKYIKRDIKEKDLAPKNLGKTYLKIINQAIKEILYERNSVHQNEEDYEWIQLFNFKYSDGVPMLTIGGILVKGEEHRDQLRKIEFQQLSFVQYDQEHFDISIPNLTIKEIKFLESIMPNGINDDGSLKEEFSNYSPVPRIPKVDVLKFAKIYKYFPTFTEARIG